MVRRNAPGIIGIALIGLWLISYGSPVQAAKENKDGSAVMTQAELQSQVMSFADRYFSIITSAI